MPHAAVGNWKTILKLVREALASTQHTSHTRLRDKADSILAEVSRAGVYTAEGPLPRAAWKQLINDLQVPRHLGAACCSLQLGSTGSSSSSNSSSNSSSSSHGSSCCRFAVWEALWLFTTAAIQDLLRDKQGAVDVDNPNTLARSVAEQLQQSGLLQQLPDLLLAAAELLQNLDPAAAATVAAAEAARATGAPATAGFVPGLTINLILRVLDVSPNLMTFQQVLSNSRPDVAAAAASLTLAAMQHLSKAIDLCLPGEVPPSSLGDLAHTLLKFAAKTTGYVVCDAATAQLLLSQEFMAVLTVLVCAAYTRAQLPLASSSSSSSSSSTGTGTGAAAGSAAVAAALAAARTGHAGFDQFAWHAAAVTLQQQQQKYDRQCEQQQQQLAGGDVLGAAGVSVPGVAFLAAHMTDPFINTTFLAAAVTGKVMTNSWDDVGEQQQQQGQRQEGQGPQPASVAAVQQPLHMLLLVHELPCTALQGRHSGMDYANNCGAAAGFAHGVIEATVQWGKDHGQSQLVQGMLCLWFCPVLPVITQMMTSVQQQVVGLSEAAGGTGSSSCGNGGTGSSSSGNGGASSSSGNAANLVHICIAPLVHLLSAAVQRTSRPPPSAAQSGTAVAAAAAQAAQAFTEHNAQISMALEGLLRLLGSMPVVLAAPKASGEVVAAVADLLMCSDKTNGLVGEAVSPGGPQQLQLFSLLCSLLKLAPGSCTCWHVAYSAREMLVSNALAHPAGPSAHAPVGSALQLPDALHGLPWLVVIGRVCLHWASELQQLQASRPELGQQLLQLQGLQRPSNRHVAEVLQVDTAHAAVAMAGYHWAVGLDTFKGCMLWLLGEDMTGTAGVLSAAGYPTDAVLRLMDPVLEARHAPRAAPSAAAAAAAYSQLVQELQALDEALNTLAVPHACNNPGCSSMVGPTELAAVSGRSCMCGGCRVARYCSRGCQKQHWKQHKPVCQSLAAAAVGKDGAEK